MLGGQDLCRHRFGRRRRPALGHHGDHPRLLARVRADRGRQGEVLGQQLLGATRQRYEGRRLLRQRRRRLGPVVRRGRDLGRRQPHLRPAGRRHRAMLGGQPDRATRQRHHHRSPGAGRGRGSRGSRCRRRRREFRLRAAGRATRGPVLGQQRIRPAGRRDEEQLEPAATGDRPALRVRGDFRGRGTRLRDPRQRLRQVLGLELPRPARDRRFALLLGPGGRAGVLPGAGDGRRRSSTTMPASATTS